MTPFIGSSLLSVSATKSEPSYGMKSKILGVAAFILLYCPWSDAIWLLTELDPEDPDIAFGLCDLGMGFPELGNVSLSEMAAISGPGGLRIQRDDSFTPTRKLSTYARLARIASRIVK